MVNLFSEKKESIKMEIDPSNIIAVGEILKIIDKFDFNIFELNELVEKKSLHFILYEIFDRYDYFTDMIDEVKYKNFIYKIIDGYSRNVSYHNDLHAADVLQTTFIMIEHGDLINVSNEFIIETGSVE
jgi:hypothetical protein